MNLLRQLTVLLIACLAGIGSRVAAAENAAPNASSAPVKIIYDTDMWSDFDDALALGMLHALADRGEAEILGVTLSTDDVWCAAYVDLLNRYYGRDSVPIGMVRGGVNPSTFANIPWLRLSFTQYVSELKGTDGKPLYDRSIGPDSQVADATTLLRKLLADQPDASVVIVQVGFSTNLARLLASKPDQISPLAGRGLVAKKVRLLSLMGGNFGETKSLGKTFPAGAPETNIIVDVPSAKTLFKSWPTPIVASGFEIGLNTLYSGERIATDFKYARKHPIVDTYVFADELIRARIKSSPQSNERLPENGRHNQPMFDLTSVLYAVRPERNYFGLSNPGTIEALDGGKTRFTEAVGGLHRHLILDTSKKELVEEVMELLVSQPPRSH